MSQNKDASNKVVQSDGTKQQQPKTVPQPAAEKPAQTGTSTQTQKSQQSSSQWQQQPKRVTEQQRPKPEPPKVQTTQNKSTSDKKS